MRIAAVERKLADASLLKVTADLGLVVAEQSTHVIFARKIFRQRVVNTSLLMFTVGKRAHSAE